MLRFATAAAFASWPARLSTAGSGIIIKVELELLMTWRETLSIPSAAPIARKHPAFWLA